jgi:hypothetical protein
MILYLMCWPGQWSLHEGVDRQGFGVARVQEIGVVIEPGIEDVVGLATEAETVQHRD